MNDCKQIGNSFEKIRTDMIYYSRPEHWQKLIEHVQKRMVYSIIDLVGTFTEAYLAQSRGDFYRFGEMLGKAL